MDSSNTLLTSSAGAVIRRGPRARARHHDWIDERSRALGAAIGECLRADPTLVSRAWARLATWERTAVERGDRRIMPALHEWRELLRTLDLDALIAFLSEATVRATRLRQSSPFVGILSDSERAAIFRQFEQI